MVELSLLCSQNLAVSEHLVSPTHVGYVSFVCLPFLGGQSKNTLHNYFNLKFPTLQSNNINHIQYYLFFLKFKSFPQYYKVPLLCFFKVSASNLLPQYLMMTKSPSWIQFSAMFDLHHKRWFHRHPICL